jgi:hypothetical protein
VTIDEKLQELDDLLKGVRDDLRAIAARAFDVELSEAAATIEAGRLLVAGVRLELNFVKERLE